MAVCALLVAGWTIFIYGGHVQMCLGPLDVTPEACRSALGLPPETAWDRFANGPGLLVALVAIGWISSAVIALARRRTSGQSNPV